MKIPVQPHIAAIVPYPPGKPMDELEREYGVTNAIKLASNENPLGMSVRARDAAITAIGEISRYPDGGAFAL